MVSSVAMHVSRRPSRRLGIGAGLVALAVSVTVAGPVFAATGQVDVAVATATGLDVAVQADGAPASAWTIEHVASGSGWGSPSIYRVGGVDGGSVVMTAVDGDGSLWFFWQAAGSSTWNPEEVAGPGSADTLGQPSVAVQEVVNVEQPTVAMIVAEDPENPDSSTTYASTYYWETVGGTVWHQAQLPTGTGTALQPDVSISAADGFLVTYGVQSPFQGSPSGFGLDQMPYGSTAWSSVNTIETGVDTATTSVIGLSNGGTVVAAGGYYGATYFYWSAPGQSTTTWHAENVGAGDGSSIPLTYIQPMALTGDAQGIAVGAVNTADTCDVAYDQANGGTGWTPQTIGCPGASSVIPALAWQSGTYNEVASAVVPNGNVHFYWQASGTTTWHEETIPGLSNAYPSTSLIAD